MSNELDPTLDPRQADLSGFSPALMMRVQKYVPTSVIQEVGKKTGGEPDLTQAIFNLLLKCYLERKYSPTNIIFFDEQELQWLEEFIESVVINKWKTVSELVPLRDVAVCLLNNPNIEPFWLLKEYQQILQQKRLLLTNSEEQKELLSLELVVLEDKYLRVHNLIYESVFNNDWLEEQLKSLSPYQLTLYRFESKSDSPYTVLEEILAWTNRDLFLTKTLCYLVWKSPSYIPAGEEAAKVNKIVKNKLLKKWEKSLASSYLIPLRDRLIKPDNNDELDLLKLYRQVLIEPEVSADYSSKQQELLQLGLLDVEQGKLLVYNPIYREIFNLDWVEKELAKKVNESLSSLNDNQESLKKNSSLQNINLFTINLLVTIYLGTIIFLYVGNTVFNYFKFQRNIEQKDSKSTQTNYYKYNE